MTTFADLGLAQPICRELERLGITQPFPIQAAAIPDALAGHDVLGRGPTGSGKTFTFGLPIINRLAGSGVSRPGAPRALILVPTRELAAQVKERLEGPAAVMGLRVLEVVGGININKNVASLAMPVDILVATPGRAQDLINHKHLTLKAVEITALDEADQMADMGFLPQVNRLLKLTPADGQRLLFSATLDGDIQTLVDRYLHEPVVHETAPPVQNVATMHHAVVVVPDRDARNSIVLEIAARRGKTIMFMRTKHGVDRQVKKLRRAGINAAGLHGDKGQNTRTAVIDAFTHGSLDVLVATDIAARGIDISDVDLVVHIDPPAEHKAYVHRAGRTARAGESGTVVTLAYADVFAEVMKLLEKAGVQPEIIEAADRNRFVAVTGARRPSGKALGPLDINSLVVARSKSDKAKEAALGEVRSQARGAHTNGTDRKLQGTAGRSSGKGRGSSGNRSAGGGRPSGKGRSDVGRSDGGRSGGGARGERTGFAGRDHSPSGGRAGDAGTQGHRRGRGKNAARDVGKFGTGIPSRRKKR